MTFLCVTSECDRTITVFRAACFHQVRQPAAYGQPAARLCPTPGASCLLPRSRRHHCGHCHSWPTALPPSTEEAPHLPSPALHWAPMVRCSHSPWNSFEWKLLSAADFSAAALSKPEQYSATLRPSLRQSHHLSRQS